jgi:hypothetical protein
MAQASFRGHGGHGVTTVPKRSCIFITALALALGVAASALAAPSAPTGLAVADLIADPGVFDPQFTWTKVTGATGYEVEINSTDYWAPGSKVCCEHISFSVEMTTYGSAFSPPVVLANNTYYWRVRAKDANGIAGPWTAGPSFTKGYGNNPTIEDLRLVDPNLDELPAGSTVDTPIVLWDPAPGASSYSVVVTPFDGACDWSADHGVRWEEKTATPGWTPLGWNRGINADPLSRGISPSDDLITHLTEGQAYCVRVSPIDRASAASGPVIAGDWTYLPANNVPAFTWGGPPDPDTCSPCNPSASDYLRPVAGSTVGRMPVFTWNPVPGAMSYFVVVAKDPFFTTIADYAYTRVAAYAPRMGSQSTGYPDETSDYYWAVLPAEMGSGYNVSTDPVSANPQPFVKQATPPTLLGPTGGVVLSTAATVFHWTPVFAARRYRLQVSDEPTFANVFQEQSALTNGAVTDSTAYTSSTAYPTGKTLYWRVQAEAENGSSGFVGLRWSTTGTFQRQAGAGGGTGTADKRFKVTVKGYPSYRKWKSVTLTVKNLATNAPIANAAVRVSGAGVDPKTKRTGSLGKVTFRIKAKRYPGTVTYRVTKSGFKTLYYTQSVRRF